MNIKIKSKKKLENFLIKNFLITGEGALHATRP